MGIWNDTLIQTIAEMTGHDPILKDEMVTLSYQDMAPDGKFRIVAIFDSAETAEMFFRLVVPMGERWRYRVTANRTVIVI